LIFRKLKSNSTFGLGTQLDARSLDIENTPSLGKDGNGNFGGRIKTFSNKPRVKHEVISELRKAFFCLYGLSKRSL
jgi:hypothetical protein